MKKVLYSLVAFAMLAGFTANAHAAETSLTWDITVSFLAEAVDLYGNTDVAQSFGVVGPSTNNLSDAKDGGPRCTLRNEGYADINYTALADCYSGWTLVSPIGANTGANNAVLAGIFTGAVSATGNTSTPFPYSRDLLLTDFDANDVLTTNTRTASATSLARNDVGDPLVDDPDWMKGYGVSRSQATTERSLRFLLQAPQSVSGAGADPQVIYLTIGAEVI